MRKLTEVKEVADALAQGAVNGVSAGTNPIQLMQMGQLAMRLWRGDRIEVSRDENEIEIAPGPLAYSDSVPDEKVDQAIANLNAAFNGGECQCDRCRAKREAEEDATPEINNRITGGRETRGRDGPFGVLPDELF